MLKYLIAKPVAAKSDDAMSAGNENFLDVPRDATVFTYHKKNAGRALLGGILMASLVEATIVHILISMWNHWVALAATLASIWFALQTLAQMRAVGLRPIYVHQEKLMLRNGAFDLVEIDVSQIASIERSTREVKPGSGELKPLNVGFPASHNVVVRLKQPTEATILNRKKRDIQIALVAVDDPNRLVDLIQQQMA